MVWTMPSTISGLVMSEAQTIQKKGTIVHKTTRIPAAIT